MQSEIHANLALLDEKIGRLNERIKEATVNGSAEECERLLVISRAVAAELNALLKNAHVSKEVVESALAKIEQIDPK